MGIQLDFRKYTLDFKFDAGTSRGILRERNIWIIKMSLPEATQFGLGECAPLPGLSIESVEDVEDELNRLQSLLAGVEIPESDKILEWAHTLSSISSVCFSLEMALLDLQNGGSRLIFDNSFSRGEQPLPINGLVWMGTKAFMKEQIDAKIKEGFNCIKIKIGAIDFEEEISLLRYIRKEYKEKELIIRVDANGAFSSAEAMSKLKILSEFQLHSIEQPIAAGQFDEMAKLCSSSPVPVALDEELIGVSTLRRKRELLERIHPPYIILKPSLMGGIGSTMDWIALANELEIGWWITSALESNIGLNAIAQLTGEYEVIIPQGLGTGKLYRNNFESPLSTSKGSLQLNIHNHWNYSELQGFC